MGVPQICALLERMSLVRNNNEHKGVINLFRVWQTVSRGQDWGPDGTSESTLLSLSAWRWLKCPQTLFCGSLWASLCILNPFSLNLYLHISRACWTLDSLLIFKSKKNNNLCVKAIAMTTPQPLTHTSIRHPHLFCFCGTIWLLWKHTYLRTVHSCGMFFWSCCAFWPAKGSLFSHLQTKWLTDF